MNGYIAFYNGQKIEVRAKTLWDAVQIARVRFKAPKSKHRMVHAVLADIEGKPVIHDTAGV
jgi:hypothetical protein